MEQVGELHMKLKTTLTQIFAIATKTRIERSRLGGELLVLRDVWIGLIGLPLMHWTPMNAQLLSKGFAQSLLLTAGLSLDPGVSIELMVKYPWLIHLGRHGYKKHSN